MDRFRAALLAALVGVGAVACGGDPEAEVEAAFTGYHTALLARDFPTACGYNSPDATAALIASLGTQGIRAGSCEEAFTAIFAEPGAADTFDEIARSAAVQDVEVDGDRGTITWTATLDGESRPSTIGVRRIDGGWKLDAAAA